MNPFEAAGVWLKCALHAHTTNSDGELAPDLLVRHYDWAGYDVLAITDHWIRTVERSTRRLLAAHRAFVHARLPAGSSTSIRAYGVSRGRSRRAAVISPAPSRSRISAPTG